MSLAATPFPDDAPLAVAEVVTHLVEIDSRGITDTHQLAQAWVEVHHCDSDVLDALDPAARREYLTIVNGPRRPAHAVRSWSARSALRVGVGHLRVAIHRRLVLLRDL